MKIFFLPGWFEWKPPAMAVTDGQNETAAVALSFTVAQGLARAASNDGSSHNTSHKARHHHRIPLASPVKPRTEAFKTDVALNANAAAIASRIARSLPHRLRRLHRRPLRQGSKTRDDHRGVSLVCRLGPRYVHHAHRASAVHRPILTKPSPRSAHSRVISRMASSCLTSSTSALPPRITTPWMHRSGSSTPRLIGVRASGDQESWKEWISPACITIVEAYIRGTSFGIKMGGDRLIVPPARRRLSSRGWTPNAAKWFSRRGTGKPSKSTPVVQRPRRAAQLLKPINASVREPLRATHRPHRASVREGVLE